MSTGSTSNDRTPTDRDGTPIGSAAGCELAEQYWTTMARTADLVRKLTSLADRYEAALQDGDADGRLRVALLRTTADSGRLLIRSLAPPAPADRGRRVRGVAGGGRPDVSDRRCGACDRTAAEEDRAEALAARRGAERDRDRTASGPAIGIDSGSGMYVLVSRLEPAPRSPSSRPSASQDREPRS